MLSRRIFSILCVCPSIGLSSVLARKDDWRQTQNQSNHEGDSSSSTKIRTLPDSPFHVFRSKSVVAKKERNSVAIPREGNRDKSGGATPSTTVMTPCPPTYDPNKTDYISGSIVAARDTLFACRQGPYEKYCNIATLDQLEEKEDSMGSNSDGNGKSDKQLMWLDAWEDVGKCSNLSPSVEDSNDISLNSLGLSFSNDPTTGPSSLPSGTQSNLRGTAAPSKQPATLPSSSPSTVRTNIPSNIRSNTPSRSEMPTYYPTQSPTPKPSTKNPTRKPTLSPSSSPTNDPTLVPTTPSPSLSPITRRPTFSPSISAVSPAAPAIEGATSFDCDTMTQIHLRIELVTDNYPKDVSWDFIDRTNNVILASSPLDGYSGKNLGEGKMESQVDIRDICIDTTMSFGDNGSTPDMYEFIIRDTYGDGLCCREGIVQGHYKLLQYTQTEEGESNENVDENWTLLVYGSEYNTKEVHHFLEIQPISPTTDLEQANFIIPLRWEVICPPPQRKITIEILTDSFGQDTSWEFRKIEADGNGGLLLAKNERSYRNQELDRRDVCLDDASLYELTVKDTFGDGMCCRYKKKGHYKILTRAPPAIDDGSKAPRSLPKQQTILHGGFFQAKQIKHLINTTVPIMSNRDEAWLHSHNIRRQYWHEYYDTTYIPLLWSESLVAEAQTWADKLLDFCGKGMRHDPERIHGENAAGNTGSRSWGTRREPELIVARFVDAEVDDEWPKNGHLTQTLWRATKYVGCAESHKLMNRNRQCHTQVCRYARTGNCNMAAFKDENGIVDWKTAMLEDLNWCGPICPSGGCRA